MRLDEAEHVHVEGVGLVEVVNRYHDVCQT
jgi:hypothetical protein